MPCRSGCSGVCDEASAFDPWILIDSLQLGEGVMAKGVFLVCLAIYCLGDKPTAGCRLTLFKSGKHTSSHSHSGCVRDSGPCHLVFLARLFLFGHDSSSVFPSPPTPSKPDKSARIKHARCPRWTVAGIPYTPSLRGKKLSRPRQYHPRNPGRRAGKRL